MIRDNRGELALRGAVIGRRLSFGSDSEKGAGFTATMYYDRNTKRVQPKKDIWLRPLRKNWRRTLNR